MNVDSSATLETEPRERRWWMPALLVLATFAVYAPCLTGPFLFDDALLGYELPFRSRPLVRLTFLFNLGLSRTDPLGYHLFNVLVHAGAGLFLFALVRRTLELARGAGTTNTWLAWAAALVWLVHPLQTESVAYISQRAESLAGLFVLGLFAGFVRFAGVEERAGSRARRLGWALFALVCFALGMATKEIVAAVPPLVLLYDRQFLAGGFARALKQRAVFYLALAALWVGLFLVFIGGLVQEAYAPVEAGAPVGYRVTAFTPLEYARTQPAVILHYLKLCFWPHPLCLDYAWPAARAVREYLPQTLVLGALGAATLWLVVRSSWLGFAGAWFFVNLAPTSSVVPIQDAAFEHRMYLPLAAVVVVSVIGGWTLARRLAPDARWLPGMLLALVATPLVALTVRRAVDYRSPVAMWSSVVAVAPHNGRAQGSLGVALVVAGRPAEAVAAFERALAQGAPIDHAVLGRAYLDLGQPGKAIESFETALGMFDYRSGMLLLDLGRAYAAHGDRARALEHYRRAAELEPTPPILATLGEALAEAGDAAGAQASFARALASGEESAGLHFSLAQTLRLQGKLEAAVLEYEAALRLEPLHQDAHTNLGATLSMLGRRAEALEHFAQALSIAPNSALEHFNYARSLLASNRLSEGLEQLRRSAELDGSLWQPREALARALNGKAESSAAEREEALRAAEEAARLSSRAIPEVLETLGEAHARRGESAAALSAFEEALARGPAGKNAALVERVQRRQAELRARAAGGG